MNYSRILIGGVAAGIVLVVVNFLTGSLVLRERYELLEQGGVLRPEPRLPFFPLYVLGMFAVGALLVWLYAAVRPRPDAGPHSAIGAGLTVGLISGVPGNFSQFCWSHVGGYVSLWWALSWVVGRLLATIAGAWVYRE
jgi:hypothetical protein